MHSHDRTLLASLGFADPDKKDSKHDLACQYLSQEHVALSLLNLIGAGGKGTLGWEFTKSVHEVLVSKGEGKYRSHIGFLDTYLQYKELTAGADLVWLSKANLDISPILKDFQYYSGEISATLLNDNTLAISHRPPTRYSFTLKETPDPVKIINDNHEAFLEYLKGRISRGTYSVAVEVKVNKVSVGDIMRQINLYREHFQYGYDKPEKWVVVTLFDLTSIDTRTLLNNGIHQVRLGSKFDAFCQERDSQPIAAEI